MGRKESNQTNKLIVHICPAFYENVNTNAIFTNVLRSL